jgi:hypothetical protein
MLSEDDLVVLASDYVSIEPLVLSKIFLREKCPISGLFGFEP